MEPLDDDAIIQIGSSGPADDYILDANQAPYDVTIHSQDPPYFAISVTNSPIYIEDANTHFWPYLIESANTNSYKGLYEDPDGELAPVQVARRIRQNIPTLVGEGKVYYLYPPEDYE